MGSAGDEAVHEESARPDDVWLVRPEEVRQGLRQMQEQGLQQGEANFVLSERQQQHFADPLQDNTVSSTTPDL